MNLKHQLRHYMKTTGLNAAQLARRAGVPKTTLNDWLGGTPPRNIGHVKRVADSLGTTLDNLLYGEGEDVETKKVTELEALVGGDWVSGVFEVRLRRLRR